MKKIWKMITKDGIEVPCQKILGNDKDVYYAKSINMASMVEFDDGKLTAHIDTHRDYVFKSKEEYEIYKNNLDDIQRINGWGECEVH